MGSPSTHQERQFWCCGTPWEEKGGAEAGFKCRLVKLRGREDLPLARLPWGLTLCANKVGNSQRKAPSRNHGLGFHGRVAHG